MSATLKRVIWWVIKIGCGLAVGIGALMTVAGIAFLVPLLAGWVQPDLDIPPVKGAVAILVIGLIQMIVGFTVPKLLEVDRLLE